MGLNPKSDLPKFFYIFHTRAAFFNLSPLTDVILNLFWIPTFHLALMSRNCFEFDLQRACDLELELDLKLGLDPGNGLELDLELLLDL